MRTRLFMRGVFVIALAFAPLAQATGWGLGTDIIRFVDQNQDSDGLFNFFVQAPAGYSGAVVVGYAGSDDLEILDVGYKHYMGGRFNGTYFQAGVGYYDNDAVDDDDLGFVGKVGYEHKLARNFAVTGAVRMVAGIDENVIGYSETPVYQPMLGVLVTF